MSVVWLTGLPASGKSTVASLLRDELAKAGDAVMLLDGDEVREIIVPEPTYSDEERDFFYGALGRLAELGSRACTVIVAATAPKRRYRDDVRSRVPSFVEVLLIADPTLLEARDPKGLYARARAGEIERLPGRGAPFEDPAHPDLVFDTGRTRAADIAKEIAEYLRHVGVTASPSDALGRSGTRVALS